VVVVNVAVLIRALYQADLVAATCTDASLLSEHSLYILKGQTIPALVHPLTLGLMDFGQPGFAGLKYAVPVCSIMLSISPPVPLRVCRTASGLVYPVLLPSFL
jgi:hypothetical protein